VTTGRALLFFASLALATAFFPAFSGQLPAPVGGALNLLPEPRFPADRNHELSDVANQLLPPTQAVADAYRRGRLPLRFAAQGCGEPLWANPVAQAVTPTTVFFLLFPTAWASAAGAALKLFLAAAGAYLFARSRGLTALASSWTGLAFGFSIYFTAWMHFPQPWAHAFFPWALLALERVATGSARGFVAVLLVVFLLLLGGYPEGEFYVALLGTAFFLLALWRQSASAAERRRRFFRAAAAALLALGLTAAYTLPVALAIPRSERSVQVSRGMLRVPAAFTARSLLRPPEYWRVTRFWIVPEAQGNPRDGDKFGDYSFAGRASGHAGILVLCFALATFFRPRAPAWVGWARAAVFVTALYVLWYPPLSSVLLSTPLVRDVAARLTTNRASGILILFLALLAGFELDRIRAGGSLGATRAGLSIGLGAALLVFAEYVHVPDRPPLTLSAPRAASFAVPALLILAALVLLVRPLSPGRARALALLAVAGTAFELLRIGARFNPGTRPSDWFPVTPKVREIQEAARGGRFASAEPTLDGMAYMYGLEDVRVHDAMAPADYEDTLVASAGYTGPFQYTARVGRLDAPFLEFLNTRARLATGSALWRRSTPAATLPERLIGTRDGAELLAGLARETDFTRTAFVIGPDEAFGGSADLLSFEKPRPEELRIGVRADRPRVLVVPETTDGGWTAESAGERLATITANGAFLAIRVPAGRSEIVCRYEPPGFRLGLAISAACLSILLGLALNRVSGLRPQASGKGSQLDT